MSCRVVMISRPGLPHRTTTGTLHSQRSTDGPMPSPCLTPQTCAAILNHGIHGFKLSGSCTTSKVCVPTGCTKALAATHPIQPPLTSWTLSTNVLRLISHHLCSPCRSLQDTTKRSCRPLTRRTGNPTRSISMGYPVSTIGTEAKRTGDPSPCTFAKCRIRPRRTLRRSKR